MESIILYFRLWIGYGVEEKVLDWIRIAKFPYPHTTVIDQGKTSPTFSMDVRFAIKHFTAETAN